MKAEYWSLSLDALSEDLFDELASNQDGPASHYARYTGTRAECVEKAMAAIRKYVEKSIYRSVGYGYPYDPAYEEEE